MGKILGFIYCLVIFCLTLATMSFFEPEPDRQFNPGDQNKLPYSPSVSSSPNRFGASGSAAVIDMDDLKVSNDELIGISG